MRHKLVRMMVSTIFAGFMSFAGLSALFAPAAHADGCLEDSCAYTQTAKCTAMGMASGGYTATSCGIRTNWDDPGACADAGAEAGVGAAAICMMLT